jgi:hypothetical protein
MRRLSALCVFTLLVTAACSSHSQRVSEGARTGQNASPSSVPTLAASSPRSVPASSPRSVQARHGGKQIPTDTEPCSLVPGRVVAAVLGVPLITTGHADGTIALDDCSYYEDGRQVAEIHRNHMNQIITVTCVEYYKCDPIPHSDPPAFRVKEMSQNIISDGEYSWQVEVYSAGKEASVPADQGYRDRLTMYLERSAS